MKRWLTHFTITLYLGFLAIGIVCHTANWGVNSHPVMYFNVWDMFCGWAAYELRYHVVGEGESGTFYELLPGPWGDIRPYGPVGRRHYDPNALFSLRMAMNTLKHTDHEPMARLFVIEENWAKKYNLPDWLWNRCYEEPKDKFSYFRLRHIVTGDGALLRTQESWLAHQNGLAITNNPRLHADARRGQPFIAVDGLVAADPMNAGMADINSPVGAPHGN